MNVTTEKPIVRPGLPGSLSGWTMALLAILFLAIPSFVSAGGSRSSAAGQEQKLAGTWPQPDGGYVLVLSEVQKGGMLRAAYFNPRPIHVAKAEWRRMGDRIQVFVELRDVNYPGSIYTLIYDGGQDRFIGYYYQAALGQTYDVVFVRRKERGKQ
jgi:hypothetical protein